MDEKGILLRIYERGCVVSKPSNKQLLDKMLAKGLLKPGMDKKGNPALTLSWQGLKLMDKIVELEFPEDSEGRQLPKLWEVKMLVKSVLKKGLSDKQKERLEKKLKGKDKIHFSKLPGLLSG